MVVSKRLSLSGASVSTVALAILLTVSPGRTEYCPAVGDFISGQGPYIGGVVTDTETGLPFAGVRAVLYCCESGTDYNETATDGVGRYSLGGETQGLGFWINACYNVRIDDACYELSERIERGTPTCPRAGEEDCFQFLHCDDRASYQVDFKVKDICCGPLECGHHAPLMTVGRAGGDRLRLSSVILSQTVSLDPPNEEVTIALEDADGLIYTATIPAGNFSKIYHGWLFRDPSGATANGIRRARISKSAGRHKLKAVVTGIDLSAADKPLIRVSLTIGDNCFRTTNVWSDSHRNRKQCIP